MHPAIVINDRKFQYSIYPKIGNWNPSVANFAENTSIGKCEYTNTAFHKHFLGGGAVVCLHEN